MYHNTTMSMASNRTMLFCRDKFNKEFANAVKFAVRSCCGDCRLALEAVLEALGHVSSIILHSTGKITFMQMNNIIRPPVCMGYQHRQHPLYGLPTSSTQRLPDIVDKRTKRTVPF